MLRNFCSNSISNESLFIVSHSDKWRAKINSKWIQNILVLMKKLRITNEESIESLLRDDKKLEKNAKLENCKFI